MREEIIGVVSGGQIWEKGAEIKVRGLEGGGFTCQCEIYIGIRQSRWTNKTLRSDSHWDVGHRNLRSAFVASTGKLQLLIRLIFFWDDAGM
ncbi:hypothetical protein T06_9218 [Trichinella sp. T6]|nr:hypothetical protein T06_9218 [Trichinella sp. T6]